MKIVCVSGGSYKSFYLNFFLKMRVCDLLIFNFGIFYDCVNDYSINLVKNELVMLSNKLHTTIVAGINIYINDVIEKRFIVCRANDIKIHSCIKSVNLRIKSHHFAIGIPCSIFSNANKIILNDKKINPIISHCNPHKLYIFCDRFGLNIVENRKLKRKFYKYSKIILK